MYPDRAAGIACGKARTDCSKAQIDYLLELIEQTKTIPGDIAEFGSWRCGASIVMASASTRHVHAFDLWGGLPYGDGYGFENFATVDYNEVQRATRPFGIVLHRGLHEQTVPKFATSQTRLSLIFLDSDHYSSHSVVLKLLAPRLLQGGVIAFHDWGFPEVQQAIREHIDPKEFHLDQADVGGMRAIRAL